MNEAKSSCQLSQASIKQVYQIVAEATQRKRTSRKARGISSWYSRIEKWVWLGAIASFSVLGVIAVVAQRVRNPRLYDVALLFAVLTDVFAFMMILGPLLAAMPYVRDVLKRPFSPLLSRIEEAAMSEAQYVNHLARHDKVIIEYVLTHYRFECNSFERRGAMIAGAIEKIGLFPALLSFAAIAISLVKTENSFIMLLIGTTPAFYVMVFAVWGINQRMDRIIALLEFTLKAIDKKQCDAVAA